MFKQLDEKTLVAGQLRPEQLDELRRHGVTMIVNNRPDGEEPGIGPVLAGRIVEWREANGGFRSVDGLGEVSGIGDAVLEQVRPLVAV